MVELSLLAPEDCVENVSDALVDELESLAVSVEDADADHANERPWFGEPGMPLDRFGWKRSNVRALFNDEQAATRAATLLLAQPWAEEVHVQAMGDVPDEDWVRLTQSQFEPVAITPEFWIVPSWHEPPAKAQRVIRLDPGLAFGTGTHPTTRMCLRWTAREAKAHSGQWARVLDYGCGSGILAIAASLHGAQHVDAVDIDPAAIAATNANAAANGASLNSGLPDTANGRYDLVFANILAAPLTLLAPLLCDHVAPGGSLVLAGILERQAESLQAAYSPWLTLQVAEADDGWILMTAQRPD